MWDPSARRVTCLTCWQAPAPPLPVDAGQPGASALRRYERLHQAREEHARARLGPLGNVLAKVIEEPASTRAWQQGGRGEVRVAQRLEHHLEGSLVRLLHDRRVPGHGQANIDHIAVGPGGVTVIDAKTHRGKIRRDRYGGLFVDRRTILRVNGRDQTRLITGVEKQVGWVREALGSCEGFASVDVAGALCFPNVDGLPLLTRIEVRGVLVDGPKPVARLAGRPGALGGGSIERIWAHLARAFPPA